MRQYAILALAALALAACNKKPDKNASKPAVQPKSAIEAVPYSAPQYLSADLAMQDLGGQVKSMTYSTAMCDPNGQLISDPDNEVTIYFDYDQQGNFTRAYALTPDDKGYKITRDDKGRIKQLERHIDELNFTYVDQFTYNDNGTLATEQAQGYDNTSKTTYNYTDGVLTSADVRDEAQGEVYTVHATYKVLSVDNHGNWVKRFTTYCQTVTSPGIPADTAQAMEIRAIEYYK